MTPRLASSLVALAGVGLAVSIAASAAAHARVISPTPRSPRDDIKGNTICGDPADNPADAAVTVYKEGQGISVVYRETIQHVGCFVGKILENGDTKATLLFNVNDPDNSLIDADTTIDAALPPGLTCNKCTLQFNQVMSGTLCNGTVPDAPTYHACSTITITYPDGAVPPPYVAPDAGKGTSTGTTSGTTAATDDPTGMDHGTTAGTTSGTENGVEDDGADDRDPTAPKSALCSVGAVGAPVGFGAALFAFVGLAFARRRRDRQN